MIAGYPIEIMQTTGNAVRTARIVPGAAQAVCRDQPLGENEPSQAAAP